MKDSFLLVNLLSDCYYYFLMDATNERKMHMKINLCLSFFKTNQLTGEFCCEPEGGAVCGFVFSEFDRLSLRV